MTVTVTPTSEEPTHLVSLSDGTTTYGLNTCDNKGQISISGIRRTPIPRTSMKTYSGSTQYTDFEAPYTPIAQDDWSGGRGNEEFERDKSRFFDSKRLNTWQYGQLILGPQETYCTGYRNQDTHLPGSVTFQALTGSQRYLAYKFDDSAAYSADRAFLLLRKVGTPNGAVTVEICPDDSGDPGTPAKTITLAVASAVPFESRWYEFDWATTTAFSGSGTYHIKIYGASGDDSTNHWAVGVEDAAGATQQSANNTSWAAASVDLYFRILDADTDWETLFYEYRGQLYFVTKPANNGAAKVYINGDRGIATGTQSTTTLADSTKSWTTNEWAGCVVKITNGTGKGRYRTITSNTATALTVPTWDITPVAASSEYVILASNKWTERSTTGLTVAVTDVLPLTDFVYFAQGDSTNIRRMREYDSSGTWTIGYADDSTNKATFLQDHYHPEDGLQITKANNTDDTDTTVARASAATSWTDLSFGTAKAVGDRRELITGLEAYGDPKEIWVLKEGSLWRMSEDVPIQVPLDEIKAVASEYNGRAHLVHDVYLYFSLLHSLERYFKNNLDDIGPSRDAGMPATRQGPIIHMIGYPGRIFAAIDAGTSGYSSVLLWNGLGWHEVYRAPLGERIKRLHLQVIPGTTIDRLWVNQGMDVIWLPMPSLTFDPYRDSNYRFTHEGMITTAWMYMGMQDIPKFFHTLTLFTENAASGAQVVDAEYQTDDSSTWVAIGSTFDTSPSEEVHIEDSSGVSHTTTGKRIRFRLRLQTDDNTETPKVKASVLEAVGRIDVKFRYDLTFLASDEAIDLEGDDDTYSAAETLTDDLDTWAASATPLTMRCVYSPYDNKTVFPDPTSLRPFGLVPGEFEYHTGSISLIEA